MTNPPPAARRPPPAAAPQKKQNKDNYITKTMTKTKTRTQIKQNKRRKISFVCQYSLRACTEPFANTYMVSPNDSHDLAEHKCDWREFIRTLYISRFRSLACSNPPPLRLSE